jgi:hypothetical protein
MPADLGWLRIYLTPNSLQCQPPLGVFLASFQQMAWDGALTPVEHARGWVSTWEPAQVRVLHAALADFLDRTRDVPITEFADFLDDIGCALLPVDHDTERAELEAIATMLGTLLAVPGTGTGRDR